MGNDALRKRLLYWEVSVEDIRKVALNWEFPTLVRLAEQGNVVAQCGLHLLRFGEEEAKMYAAYLES